MPKPADIKINLAPKDPFFETTIGKFLNWALHVGRYIVIFTELVVILSFASRFTLDRRVTDLNESIHQKRIIAESYGPLENNFRLAQEKIKSYEQIEQTNNLVEVFPKLQRVVPKNIQLVDLLVEPNGISLEAVAASNNALNLFINNLQLSPDFSEVTVSRIETRGEKQPGFVVLVKANTAEIIEKSKE